MKLSNTLTLTLVLSLLGAAGVRAQISEGGTPPSFERTTRATVTAYRTAPIDVDALLEEDERTPKDIPFRFGFPFDVQLDMNNSGTWETLPDGSRLWRLQIECPGAYSINLIYDRFWLPDGAKFFIYNGDRSHLIGAFTSRNNKDYGKFATQPVRGDISTLEYWEPAGLNSEPEFRLSRIVHAYRNIFAKDFSRDFGSSGACNNNARCPEWDEFDNLIRSAAMITTSGGFRLCSGAMVNNVRQDLTPYFLTANHCLGGSDTWVFMFNYESPSCANIDGPTYMTVSGSSLKASASFSDFALLELSEQPPDSYNVYYAGWSALDTPVDSVIAIHHPSGDIKKISFDYDAVTATTYLGTAIPGDNSHWRIGQWEDGTTEPGSSGSPIFNRDGQIIGQLHGGYASCASITSDWYGKVSQSWDHFASTSQQLKVWLDPDNTGVLTLNGKGGSGISITHQPLLDTEDTLNDYAVTATIVSDTTLVGDSLLLHYEIASVPYQDTLTPTANPDEFIGYIPAQSPGTEISYYLLAVDSEGKADTTDLFQFRIIDYGLTLTPVADTMSGPVDDSIWFSLRVTNTGVYDDDYGLSVSGNTWATDLFDQSGTTPISSSGLISAGNYTDFLVRVIIPASVYGDFDLATISATSTGDPSFSAASVLRTVSDGQPVSLPFEDEFPATSISAANWVQTTGAAVTTVALAEPSPPYSLNLNGSPSGADTMMSQVIDLDGEANVIVRYYYQRTGGGDSPEANDNLYVEYKDNGGVWQLLQTHLGDGPDMTEFEEVRVTLPANAYHSAFRLRLRNFATSGAFDDWFVDDIYVGPPPPYDLSLTPPFASAYGPAGDTVTYATLITNKGAQGDEYAFSASGGAWPVSFWDPSGTTMLTTSGLIPAGDSAQLICKIEIPAGTPMNILDSVVVRATSTGDPLVFDDALLVTLSAGPPGGFPWYEPLPVDTLISARWITNVGAVVSSSALNPPSAPYSLCLDGGVDTIASQPINLDGLADVLLSYYFQRGGSSEPPDAGDDLWIEYKNNSGTWTLVNQHPGGGAAMTTFQQVTYSLPANALHSSFQVRLRSFGSGANSDYWFIDNISVDYSPEISISPLTLDATLTQGDSSTTELIINNTGLGALTYNLSLIPVVTKGNSRLGDLLAAGNLEPPFRNYPEGFHDYDDPKGADDPRQGFPVEKDAGGPDGYGYFWIDSDEPGGPTFDWIDVSATGTDIIGDLNDDNFGGPYPLGFSFPFYDTAYSQIYIGSNGIIGFSSAGMNSRFKKQIPNDSVPNALLAWLWDDLNPDDADNANGHVYVDTIGGRCVIQFVDYPEYGANAGDVITAEVILEADGSIRYQYHTIAPGFDAASSTIGIESPDGTNGLEVAYLTPYLKNSFCIEFIQPYQWLALGQYGGALGGGEADTIPLTFRTTELDSGSYLANLIVSNNDPDNTPIILPASLTVIIPPQYICGDASGDDDGPNVGDLTYLVNYLFRAGSPPPTPAAADVDSSGGLDVADLTYLVNFLFRGGPPPTCGG